MGGARREQQKGTRITEGQRSRIIAASLAFFAENRLSQNKYVELLYDAKQVKGTFRCFTARAFFEQCSNF